MTLFDLVCFIINILLNVIKENLCMWKEMKKKL